MNIEVTRLCSREHCLYSFMSRLALGLIEGLVAASILFSTPVSSSTSVRLKAHVGNSIEALQTPSGRGLMNAVLPADVNPSTPLF
jgi:hypothetical protein